MYMYVCLLNDNFKLLTNLVSIIQISDYHTECFWRHF